MTTHNLPLAYLRACYGDVQGKGGAATHTMSLLSRMAAIIDGRVPENPNTVSIERLDSTVDDATKAGGCGA
jgi:hypothetical protein